MTVYALMENGGPVMWPLLACSVIVLTVILERTLFWVGIERKRNRPLMDEILHLAEQRDWERIREKIRDSDDYVIRVLLVGILHREYDMGKAMEAEAKHMEKKNVALHDPA
ncbi:MotA/TolQ/ExbB proton channel family protein [Desulfolithobacter sp.]